MGRQTRFFHLSSSQPRHRRSRTAISRPRKTDDHVSALVHRDGSIKQIESRLLDEAFLQDLIGVNVDLEPSKSGLTIVRDRLYAPKRIILYHDIGMEDTAVGNLQIWCESRLRGRES